MRLDLARKTELAVRAMQTLARGGTRMKTPALARELDTTATYLPHVLRALVRQGWVDSVPGPNGGHELVVGLADVAVLEVVEAVEGPTDDGRCVFPHRRCPGSAPCAVHDSWLRARAALMSELASTPLAALSTDPSGS